jgi:hypothetical protein
MTHPGVGPVTALATEVFLGEPSRFADAKAVASSVGMIPSEYSSGARPRLGARTKQGNAMLRFLWCEAAIHAGRRDAALGRFFRRKLQQKAWGKRAWPWRASWAFGSGFSYAIRSITRSSAVAHPHTRRGGDACMRECLCGDLVRRTRDRQNEEATRLPPPGSSHESSWSGVTEEMLGGQPRSSSSEESSSVEAWTSGTLAARGHGRLRRLVARESRLRRPERATCLLTGPTSLEMSPRLG